MSSLTQTERTAIQPQWPNDGRVAYLATQLNDYCHAPPYHPPEAYPELGSTELDPQNQVYGCVRELLATLALDRENFGSTDWNPLGNVIRPGMTVFIKPNTVSHRHLTGQNIFSMITHASVIRPLLDYVRRALCDEGRIIIGDSQFLFADFDKAMVASGLKPLIDWYRTQTRLPIECLDLRNLKAVKTWAGGNWGREALPADPRGCRWIDLGRRSHFEGIDARKLRIAVAPPREMAERHGAGHHEYLLPQIVLDCDAIISIPKLKTHRRAAVSLGLKGLFGLVADKSGLPHYRKGSSDEGGDEYLHRSPRKRLASRMQDLVQSQRLVAMKAAAAALRNACWWTHHIVPFRDNVAEGMWHGNDTIWRTILDIHRAVFYADRQGRLRDRPQRASFCVLDGIIGGAGNGPLQPDPVHSGALLAAANPVALDAVAATLMGFDIRRIPTVREALRGCGADFESEIEVFEARGRRPLASFAQHVNLEFAAHPEWKGHCERRLNSS